MKIYKNPSPELRKELLERPYVNDETVMPAVQSIFSQVKNDGDAALFRLTEQFDKVKMENLIVSEQEFAEANSLVSSELKEAIALATQNINIFHAAQIEKPQSIETSKGVVCRRESRPIQAVGLYVPGGTAPLVSTVLMLGIPAKIAGCEEIYICTPPCKNGKIDAAILFAAQYIGINKVFKVGGAQAIAALTYGTQSIPKVMKIFGPGNQYVTMAKKFAAMEEIAIDMPAGPSELMVVADETAIPAYVAADLLSQAEHGADSQVILITNKEEIALSVMEELSLQIKKLPRQLIAKEALVHSKAIVIHDNKETIDTINEYAPEHLILSTKDPESIMTSVMNAGSVFIGNFTPESAGDYASGTNHTLPTNGYANMRGGVSLDDYVKKITIQTISKEGLQNIGNTIEILADTEKLFAHKNAVSIRLKNLL